MSYAAEIVLRKKEGRYYYGFASQFPLNKGYKEVNSYGRWYGSQMNYKPFREAYNEAKKECETLNKFVGNLKAIDEANK
jgi:hypothetical protein